jgi:hypothetical protein
MPARKWRDQESCSDSQATQPRLSSPPSPFGPSWMAQMTGAAFQSRAAFQQLPGNCQAICSADRRGRPRSQNPVSVEEVAARLPSCLAKPNSHRPLHGIQW